VPELERLRATRIVAKPAALDAVAWREDLLVLRIAPDEIMLLGPADWHDQIEEKDSYAIIEQDDGFVGVWLNEVESDFLATACEWELPKERPAFAQGAVAGIPGKLYFDHIAGQILIIVPAPYAADLQERLP